MKARCECCQFVLQTPRLLCNENKLMETIPSFTEKERERERQKESERDGERKRDSYRARAMPAQD
jgi:hypothetical protein